MATVDPLTLTVRDLTAAGADSVEATCLYCGTTWSALIGIMPEQTTLQKLRELLTCPTCGKSEIDIKPEWLGRPPLTH